MSRRQVIHLPESRVDEAAEALAQAFQDDPLQTYTFPDSEERKRLSPAHFEAVLRYGLLAGQVFTGIERGSGAAIWIPPGAEHTPEMAEASGLARLPETIGAEAAGRFNRVVGYAEAAHHRAMPIPHWYVMVVGVAPAFQGQGYGRALLQPILDRAETDGVPCYLETTSRITSASTNDSGFACCSTTWSPKVGCVCGRFAEGSGPSLSRGRSQIAD